MRQNPQNLNDINEILAGLSARDNLRQLREGCGDGKYIVYDGVRYLNLSSNDYLGLTADTELQTRFFEEISACGRFVMSNPASRLMTGNSCDYGRLEASLAALYPGRGALVLGSGYMVNSGVLPALTGKRDLILADKFVHASLIDGMRLCECRWERFSHNDMDHLESLLAKNRDKYDDVWVVTESLFSMDGDRAPLLKLVELKERFGLKLYLDEAHAFGVYGQSGTGLALESGVEERFDVLAATFGKATASVGAFVVVDEKVRQLLVNRMRTLIFSTALPPINLQWTRYVVDRLPEFGARRAHLAELVEIMAPGDGGATQIIPLVTGGNEEALAMAERFREAGFWTTAIRWPTVPRGAARVRVSLTAALGNEDIIKFKTIWKSFGTENPATTQ